MEEEKDVTKYWRRGNGLTIAHREGEGR